MIVARELTQLGEHPRIEEGGVSWEGDARSVARANLWLRTASRVLVRVARFTTTAFYDLEKRARKIGWSAFVAPGASAEFRVTARKSRLYHSDAIAERLVKAVAATTTVPERGRQLFVVRVSHDEFTISADTSGDLLHMRGYRQAVGKAPLRETLAAALLLAAEWKGDAPLVDPFCGSGTIAIEAALLARRIAPGINRGFAFTSWPGFERQVWDNLLEEARNASLAGSPVPVAGSDRDAGAIESARSNAERAGVAGDIVFETRAVSAVEATEERGLIATNPPYGVRVGDRSTVRDLYARFGQVVRAKFPGWRVALFSYDARLTSAAGLDLREAFRTTNGGLKVVAMRARAGT